MYKGRYLCTLDISVGAEAGIAVMFPRRLVIIKTPSVDAWLCRRKFTKNCKERKAHPAM